ncbi:MAG: TIGR03915 family putative DNA repair protein [Halanaerobiales bacterium]
MNYYIYDGSFPGLLTAIYDAFYSNEKPDKISTVEFYQQGLFDNKIKIETDLNKSDRVYQAVKDKISLNSLRRVYNAYLSEEEGIASLILKYLILGFKMGKEIDDFLNNDIVNQICRVSSRVSKEKHLLLGLLRFKEIKNGVYYAPFEPDYNITSLIAPHFSKRLSDQDWIIHDRKRKIAAIYNKEEWVITEMDNPEKIIISEDEEFYQQLWKGFYKNIAIEERKNSTLQRQFMPKRYWKYLIEKY